MYIMDGKETSRELKEALKCRLKNYQANQNFL